MALVEIIGVHPVPEAEQPCHFIEVMVAEFSGTVGVGAFIQPLAGQDKSHWQVHFGEDVLDSDGCSGREQVYPAPIQVNGNLRLTAQKTACKPAVSFSEFKIARSKSGMPGKQAEKYRQHAGEQNDGFGSRLNRNKQV